MHIFKYLIYKDLMQKEKKGDSDIYSWCCTNPRSLINLQLEARGEASVSF